LGESGEIPPNCLVGPASGVQKISKKKKREATRERTPSRSFGKRNILTKTEGSCAMVGFSPKKQKAGTKINMRGLLKAQKEGNARSNFP